MRWLIEFILLLAVLGFAARFLLPEVDDSLEAEWRVGAVVILLAAAIASRRLIFGSKPRATGKGAGES